MPIIILFYSRPFFNGQKWAKNPLINFPLPQKMFTLPDHPSMLISPIHHPPAPWCGSNNKQPERGRKEQKRQIKIPPFLQYKQEQEEEENKSVGEGEEAAVDDRLWPLPAPGFLWLCYGFGDNEHCLPSPLPRPSFLHSIPDTLEGTWPGWR